MTLAGRPPKPTALKILQGTYRPDRSNPGEVYPDLPPNLQPPEWLPEDAARKWSALAPILSRNGLLTECDLDTLALYCQTWARWRDAEDALSRDGATTTAQSGYQQVSAWVTIAKQCRADLLRLSDRLGLNPSARARIASVPDDTPDTDLLA
jgi:P27 family predicted phage terminase small subunit